MSVDKISRLVFCGLLFLECTLAVPCLSQTVEARSGFNGRAVEDAAVVTGRTCSDDAVGFSYAFPPGVLVQDGRATRIEESRVDLEDRGVQPEAGYVLWGYSESKTMAHVCSGEDDSSKIMVIAFPQEVVGQLGPNPVERLAGMLGQRFGLPPGKTGTLSVGGHTFQSVVAQGEVHFGSQSKKAFLAIYGIRVNSYYVTWEASGEDSDGKLKDVADSLASLNISSPVPLKAEAAAAGAKPEIAADFRGRLNAFLAAWLARRDQAGTLSFVDSSAYKAPAIIGSYCDGWYKTGAPKAQVVGYITSNLMGVPNAFPKGTSPRKIFGAWDRLPPEWLNEAVNDPSSDHFLVGELNSRTLPLFFRNRFANSQYEQYLAKEIARVGDIYWVVFPEIAPDGDVFVVFTVWERAADTWSITGFDVMCQ